MDETLEACIRNYGDAPRSFSRRERWGYMRVSKPRWLRKNPANRFWPLFNNMEAVYREGRVVWGCVIQANEDLFRDTYFFDDPADVVFSVEDAERVNPEELTRIASRVAELKGTFPEADGLAQLARKISDESNAFFGAQVPESISPNLRCHVSSIYIIRKHLPERMLCSFLLPLLVSPEAPFYPMVLPGRYWPSDFAREWANGPFGPKF